MHQAYPPQGLAGTRASEDERRTRAQEGRRPNPRGNPCSTNSLLDCRLLRRVERPFGDQAQDSKTDPGANRGRAEVVGVHSMLYDEASEPGSAPSRRPLRRTALDAGCDGRSERRAGRPSKSKAWRQPNGLGILLAAPVMYASLCPPSSPATESSPHKKRAPTSAVHLVSIRSGYHHRRGQPVQQQFPC